MSTALTPRETFDAVVDRAQNPVTNHFGGDKERAAAFLTALRLASMENPKIMECTPRSIIQATLHCSRLQLMPNDGQDHVHLIPYGNELQAQIGFRGYIELANRSGKVAGLTAEVVYEDEIKRGLFQATRAPFMVVHGVDPKADRTDPNTIEFAYAMCTLSSGVVVGIILQRADIEKAKQKAHGTSRADSPWKQWYDRMARKTAIKALIRSGQVPRSNVLRAAMDVEQATDPGIELVQDDLPALQLPDVSDLERGDA